MACNESIAQTPLALDKDNNEVIDNAANTDSETGSGDDMIKRGTWQNKDEDNDGISDEKDAFPFDSAKSKYPLFTESEPNDNPSVALDVSPSFPFSVKGTISTLSDNGDLYKFYAQSGKFISAVVKYDSTDFLPQIYFSDELGKAINSSLVHTNKAQKISFVIAMVPETGYYHLGVVDKKSRGDTDFTYQVNVFEDNDSDGINDQIELALGIIPTSQDTDKDTIPDFFEFYSNDMINLDLDKDNLPNMIDLDSDGDGQADKKEGLGDLDNDSILNFVDSHSDSALTNFSKTDQDNDKIFDAFDQAPNKKVKAMSIEDFPIIQISRVAGHYQNSLEKDRYRVGSVVTITGINLNKMVEPVVVVYNNKNIFNFNAVDVSKKGLSFNLDVPFGEYKVFIYNKGKKSNEIELIPFNKNSPLIFGSTSVILTKGETYTLNGIGFDNQTKVQFGDTTIAPVVVSNTEISFIVPSSTKVRNFAVKNSHGASNSIRVFKYN
jgi:hypothetical protein